MFKEKKIFFDYTMLYNITSTNKVLNIKYETFIIIYYK